MNLLKDYSDILSEDINYLCKPLAKVGITFFHFMKKYNDNSRIHLTNTPKWIDHFYNHKFFMTGSLQGDNNVYKYKSTYFLWSTLVDQTIYNEIRMSLNIGHGVTIIKTCGDSVDFFHFGAQMDHPEVVNFYLSNMDFLERFILYFKDSANKLIENAAKNRIVVPDYTRDVNKKDLQILLSPPPFSNKEFRKQFLKETKTKKYSLQLGKREVIFSDREIDCLAHLIEGKSASQAAEKLFISKRTVETHIEHIKQKMDCQSKGHIIERIIEFSGGFQDSLWRIFN